MVDSMVVANGGHLSGLILLSLRDMVCPGVARPALEGLLGERREGRGREGREHLGHGMPGPADEGVVSLIAAVVVALSCARAVGRHARGRRQKMRWLEQAAPHLY